ncbi:ABC transporter ATP-binding protein [Terribacillus saccharophilus]|uniref:Multidrug ABC transporter ATP-binding protein n=1 Tax=Terribacillus saccharophilus TaxID=361277 RepID=A0ABX4GV77_9BACI|nr:ABC transporter ATP-binding protein [Terribacillus saccharophilus]PAD34453.1 multidrug ABC transporter ATP-binding protein [Terribacillus saccharophilus]PAD95327.1 multidrug ABC transporter ATP-binding protein [Terribacillus saccharophilus]PAD98780.1 multidrug ABC transporter ATP-binding protein [Terribacillus saccharophilus]
MLKEFFAFYKPYKRLFMLDFGSAVFVAILELAFPIGVNMMVDQLLPTENWSWIVTACILLFIVYGLSTVTQYIVTYWGHKLGINIERDMRKQLFEHIQKLSFRFFDNTKVGNLISRLTNDLFMIGEMAHHGPEDLFIALMTIAGALTIMFFINWPLALMTMLVVPILFWIVLYCNKKMTEASRRMNEDTADFSSRIENTVGGIRVVQAFTNEAHEEARFKVNNERYRLTKLLSYKIMALNLSVTYMLMRFIAVFQLIAGAWFIIQGRMSYGDLVAFILLTNVFFQPIQKIGAIIELYPKGIAGFQRYMDIMRLDPDIKDAPNAKLVEALTGNIRYDNVSFGYKEGSSILKDISFSINAGETVAFVGPSGAGKSTICSLLPRFYERNAGEISIDGIPTDEMTLASLRSQIGIVQQDVYLFGGTIRENIAYGKLGATDAEIEEAARRAQLTDFLAELPKGLDTVIGERGVMISGGQKQRISIARVFLKNPPILILDEATSALDTETEVKIQEALDELSAGRTTLVIAHRLATIKHADKIIMVTKQGITEEGKHSELLEREGAYRRLYDAQFAH